MYYLRFTLSPRAVALAAVLTLADSSLAQTPPWQTVYDGPGHVQTALPDPFTTHPQPSLFLGGNVARGPVNNPFSVQWVGPLDATASPNAVVSDDNAGWSQQLGFDFNSQRLYSVGSGAAGWQVRESADEGNSWVTVDEPFGATGEFGSRATGFATDGQGNAFACGWAMDSKGYSHWVVRRRNSSGVWSTIRDRAEARKSYVARKTVIVGGFLFVVGEIDGSQWLVERMSLAQGAWQTLNTGAPKGKKAGAVAVTSFGSDLYVLAWVGKTGAAPESCLLLRGANLGAGSWTSVRSFAESIQINRPSDLAFDVAGNLYVVGDSTFATSTGDWPEAWIVRRRDALTGTWQWWTPLTDNPAAQRSFARQISVDPTTGKVFIAGTAQELVDGQQTQNWRAVVQMWIP